MPSSSLPAQAINHPTSTSAKVVWSSAPAHELPTYLHVTGGVLLPEQPSCRAAAQQSSMSNCSPGEVGQFQLADAD